MIPDWQRRRSAFNHDWLKNQYLLALDAWINLLTGEIADEEFEQRFIRDVLVQWESESHEALALLNEFEQEMSPRRLFERLPLSRCDVETRQWLGELMHRLWRERHSVDHLISESKTALSKAHKVYTGLQKSLRQYPDVQSAMALVPLKKDFSEFHKCCLHLARAVEAFPSEVRTT